MQKVSMTIVRTVRTIVSTIQTFDKEVSSRVMRLLYLTKYYDSETKVPKVRCVSSLKSFKRGRNDRSSPSLLNVPFFVTVRET